MFANGQVDVRSIDGELYINMLHLTEHILNSALVLKEDGGENSMIVAAVLGVVAQTLADLAIYTLESEQIDGVDEMLKLWTEG